MSNRSYKHVMFNVALKTKLRNVTSCVKVIVLNVGKLFLSRFSIVVFTLLASLVQAKDQSIAFDIPQQSADGALTAFADQADISDVFDFDAISKHQANGLKGDYVIKKAVELLLADTALNYEFDRGGHLIVTENKESDGDRKMRNQSKKNILTATTKNVSGL